MLLSKLTVRIPASLHMRLKMAVVGKRTSVQEVVNALIAEYVEKVEKEAE